MKNLILILITLSLTSCYTLKKAEKQVKKANLHFPILTSGFCADEFPVKDSVISKIKTIKGETIVKLDTITVDCDSVVKDAKIANKVLIRYKNIFRTDTIIKTETVFRENTAKVKNLMLRFNEKNKELIRKNTIIKSKTKTIKILLWILIPLVLLIVLHFRLKNTF